MGIGDILSSVGKGVVTGAKVLGDVAAPVGKAIANEEAGYSPQIAEEKRKHQEKLEDEAINAKATELENQLTMGQKYGTLDSSQQQKYVDSIAQLYSHPRHAQTLMEKLRKTIHPNGAYAPSPESPLPNATPQGGTAVQDEQSREHALADTLGLRQKATDEEIDRRSQDAAKYHKPAGKSPPVPGNQLPADAIGPDGQPIAQNERDPSKSFIGWNGVYYPAPKPKPLYKIVGGNVMLMDPVSGLPMRNLGAAAGVKISTHQTPVLGDDQQMHLLTTTSVTTPQGESIDVESPQGAGGEAKLSPTASDSAPKTPANKVGAILPKTGAKPASSSMGSVIPGSHAWAQSKSPLFKADVATYKKAKDAVVDATKLSSMADQVAANPNDAVNQKRLAVALERAAAGRFTTQALDYIIKSGWGNTVEQWANNPSTGALPADVMRQLVDGAHQNLRASKEALATANPEGENSPATGTSGQYKYKRKVTKTGQIIGSNDGENWVDTASGKEYK